MEKDYIEISDRRLRVEVNWNATAAYLKAVGRDTIEELSQINEIKPSELTALMAACIAEGERLDGRDNPPSALDLGATITPGHVSDFLRIYVKQSAPQMDVDPPKKEHREEKPGP